MSIVTKGYVEKDCIVTRGYACGWWRTVVYSVIVKPMKRIITSITTRER